jgi:hypothetical protein
MALSTIYRFISELPASENFWVTNDSNQNFTFGYKQCTFTEINVPTAGHYLYINHIISNGVTINLYQLYITTDGDLSISSCSGQPNLFLANPPAALSIRANAYHLILEDLGSLDFGTHFFNRLTNTLATIPPTSFHLVHHALRSYPEAISLNCKSKPDDRYIVSAYDDSGSLRLTGTLINPSSFIWRPFFAHDHSRIEYLRHTHESPTWIVLFHADDKGFHLYRPSGENLPHYTFPWLHRTTGVILSMEYGYLKLELYITLPGVLPTEKIRESHWYKYDPWENTVITYGDAPKPASTQ